MNDRTHAVGLTRGRRGACGAFDDRAPGWSAFRDEYAWPHPMSEASNGGNKPLPLRKYRFSIPSTRTSRLDQIFRTLIPPWGIDHACRSMNRISCDVDQPKHEQNILRYRSKDRVRIS